MCMSKSNCICKYTGTPIQKRVVGGVLLNLAPDPLGPPEGGVQPIVVLIIHSLRPAGARDIYVTVASLQHLSLRTTYGC